MAEEKMAILITISTVPADEITGANRNMRGEMSFNGNCVNTNIGVTDAIAGSTTHRPIPRKVAGDKP